MVKISQKDFNLDMDIYLSNKSTDKEAKPKKKSKAKEPEIEETKDRSVLDKMVDFVTGEPEAVETEAAEKKPGFLDKVKGLFSSSETEEEIGEELNEEIKNLLKIQNKWLQKLPAKTIKEFKESEDYKIYKDTLEKYNLIKHKE